MNLINWIRPGVLLGLLCLAATAQATCPAGFPLTTPDSDFADTGSGTVRHTPTGLIWKRCAEGQSWAGGTCTGAALPYTWEQAFTRAASVNNGDAGTENAGQTDWRLPNQNELKSIVEQGCYSPSINLTQFPATSASGFWSGSPYAGYPDLAWLVDFDYGNDHWGLRGNAYQVRLVRAGQYFYNFDAQGDVTPPSLTSVGVSGTTATAATLAATSDEAATGYWIVVPQGSTAPTAAQVKAGANYGAVTVTISGNGAMVAATAKSFSVSGLTAATAYDLYLVAEDASSNHNLTPSTIKVQFSTTAAPVNGLCGTDNGAPLTATPTGLCTTGAPSGVTPGTTSYDWSCAGSGGGSPATCSATRNYIVTTSVSGGNGTIGGNQTVTYNATPSFTLTPNAGYVSGPVSGCGGSLSGNSYTVAAVTASCTVVASFTAVGGGGGGASSNANLSNLTLSSGTLSPVFASATTDYSTSVSSASIAVTPTVADSTATVKVNGTAVASGSASGAIMLNLGITTVNTIVTAADGSKKTYTVSVRHIGANNYDAQIQTMYIGYFGRPADLGGLAYYADLMNQRGGDNAVLLDDFWNSSESRGLYTQATLSDKITQIYENLFGRPAETSGVTYWSNQVATNKVTIPAVAYTVAYNAQTADAAILEKKRTAAQAFMNALNTADKMARFQRNVTPARTWLDSVVDDATLAAALARIASVVAGL
jgi:hypothetical protein